MGCISTELLEDVGRVGLDGVPCRRMGASTRCIEVIEVQLCAVSDGQAFGNRRTT